MYLGEKAKRRYMQNCVLCSDAPCDKACPKGVEPSRQLRSIWFDNEAYAAARLLGENACADCHAPCETVCVKRGEVPIRKMMAFLTEEVKPKLDIEVPEHEKALQTELCGIPLENPFLLSSSVVASTYDMCARAFEAGWAGAAFKTICAFDIHEASPRFSAIHSADGSIMGFKNIEQLFDHSVPENMEIFQQLKRDYPSKVYVEKKFTGSYDMSAADDSIDAAVFHGDNVSGWGGARDGSSGKANTFSGHGRCLCGKCPGQ